MSDSVRPHRRQPTRLPHPWDSPDKNTGVGCHFPLQCMKVKSESQVAQSCPTLSDPMDHGPPGSSFHEILQARVQEWGAIYSMYIQIKCVCVCVYSVVSDPLSLHRLSRHSQAPLSMKCSWQESCSWLPFLTPGDLPDPGVKPQSLCLLPWQQILYY